MVVGKKSNDRDRVETTDLGMVLHIEDPMVHQGVDRQMTVVTKGVMETETKDDPTGTVEKIHEGIKEEGLRRLVEKIHEGIEGEGLQRPSTGTTRLTTTIRTSIQHM